MLVLRLRMRPLHPLRDLSRAPEKPHKRTRAGAPEQQVLRGP